MHPADRVKDWMAGMRTVSAHALVAGDDKSLLGDDALTPAERLRHVHHVLVAPTTAGGAGLSVREESGHGRIEAIYPLHNRLYNQVGKGCPVDRTMAQGRFFL